MSLRDRLGRVERQFGDRPGREEVDACVRQWTGLAIRVGLATGKSSPVLLAYLEAPGSGVFDLEPPPPGWSAPEPLDLAKLDAAVKEWLATHGRPSKLFDIRDVLARG